MLQRRQMLKIRRMKWMLLYVVRFPTLKYSQSYHELRKSVISDLVKQGKTVYPHKFNVSLSIESFIDKYSYLKPGEHLDDTTVSVAGRLLIRYPDAPQVESTQSVSREPSLFFMTLWRMDIGCKSWLIFVIISRRRISIR